MKKDENGLQSSFELYIPKDIRAGFETKKRVFKKKYGLLSQALIASFLLQFGTPDERKVAQAKIDSIKAELGIHW